MNLKWVNPKNNIAGIISRWMVDSQTRERRSGWQTNRQINPIETLLSFPYAIDSHVINHYSDNSIN